MLFSIPRFVVLLLHLASFFYLFIRQNLKKKEDAKSDFEMDLFPI